MYVYLSQHARVQQGQEYLTVEDCGHNQYDSKEICKQN